jgi:hypothetical protein
MDAGGGEKVSLLADAGTRSHIIAVLLMVETESHVFGKGDSSRFRDAVTDELFKFRFGFRMRLFGHS